MAKPLIYVEGHGHLTRAHIEFFSDASGSGSNWEVTVDMVSGQTHVLTFDTEAKANNAISVLKNETEIDIIED